MKIKETITDLFIIFNFLSACDCLSLKEETVIISFDEIVLVKEKDIIRNQWIFLPLIGVSLSI